MEARIRTSLTAFYIYLSDRLANFTFFKAYYLPLASRSTLYTEE